MKTTKIATEMLTKTAFLLLILQVLVYPSSVYAAGNLTLVMTAKEEVVRVDEQGRRTVEYIDAESIVPEDVLLYTINYHNAGKETATNIVITNPVPSNMAYLAESATGDNTNIRFSVDGGNNFDSPGNLFMLREDGTKRPALAGDYTHIQWQLVSELATNSRGSVSYRAQVR